MRSYLFLLCTCRLEYSVHVSGYVSLSYLVLFIRPLVLPGAAKRSLKTATLTCICVTVVDVMALLMP